MRELALLALLLLIGEVCAKSCAPGSDAQYQVALSFSGNPTAPIRITWISNASLDSPVVTLGTVSQQYTTNYTADTISSFDHGSVVLSALVGPLIPSVVYFYRVLGMTSPGNEQWSNEFNFTAPAITDTSREFSFAVAGDLGTCSVHLTAASTVRQIASHIDNLSFFLLPGDISYANGNTALWDEFGRFIEPISSRIPLMVCPGNHEGPDHNEGDFTEYLRRFRMPVEDAPAMYYSFNYASVHFVAMSTVSPFMMGSAQYEWLRADLAAARANPALEWIIVFGHHPMYSSRKGSGHGSNHTLLAVIEPLFHEYHVDLAVWAHDHSYERTAAVYREEATQRPWGCRYWKAPSTVHVVVGTGGAKCGSCQWDLTVDRQSPAWSMYRESNTFGIGHVTVFANHSLYFSYVRNSPKSLRGVADDFWLIKAPADNVGPCVTVHDGETVDGSLTGDALPTTAPTPAMLAGYGLLFFTFISAISLSALAYYKLRKRCPAELPFRSMGTATAS